MSVSVSQALYLSGTYTRNITGSELLILSEPGPSIIIWPVYHANFVSLFSSRFIGVSGIFQLAVAGRLRGNICGTSLPYCTPRWQLYCNLGPGPGYRRSNLLFGRQRDPTTRGKVKSYTRYQLWPGGGFASIPLFVGTLRGDVGYPDEEPCT